MSKSIKPLGDRIIIEPTDAPEKIGGIIIPENAKEKPSSGIVRVLGTGKLTDNGQRIPFEVKVGQRVIFSKYGCTDINVDGKQFKLACSDDILAILF